MSENVNAKLYKIQEFIVKDKNNNEELIQEIIDNYNNKSKNEFIEIKISRDAYIKGWRSKLYVYTTENKSPEWLDFLTPIVSDDDNDKLLKLQVQYSSFVLLVYDSDSIFVISKGYYGRFLLDEYIEPFFGMDVLSRLVNKTSTEIKQIEERGLFGIELGAQRFFRENFNLAFDDDFGKIYKAMLASIDKNDFEKLGIVRKKESTQKLSINGSSSLEVSSKFSYNELINRLIKIKELLVIDGVEFNQSHRLSYSSKNSIIKDLSNSLMIYAYDCLINDEVVDFYSPDIFDYLRSIETEFYNEDNGLVCEIDFCSSYSYNEIMAILIENQLIDNSSLENFIESLKVTYGRFRDVEGGIASHPKSLDLWICGEVEYQDKKYFKLDSSWYIYRNSLDKYLNEYFETFEFENFKPALSLKPWAEDNEGLYNASFKDEECFVVGDKAYLNNIEMFDVMKITDDELYLYHVKRGLGQDTRVLINQINNATRFFSYSQDEEYNLSLRKLYKDICKKNYKNKQISILKNGIPEIITEDDFVQLFIKRKKIYFVFAYASANNKTISKEIISSRSRIAKLSLIYVLRDITRVSFPLLIEKIPLINKKKPSKK